MEFKLRSITDCVESFEEMIGKKSIQQENPKNSTEFIGTSWSTAIIKEKTEEEEQAEEEAYDDMSYGEQMEKMEKDGYVIKEATIYFEKNETTILKGQRLLDQIGEFVVFPTLFFGEVNGGVKYLNLSEKLTVIHVYGVEQAFHESEFGPYEGFIAQWLVKEGRVTATFSQDYSLRDIYKVMDYTPSSMFERTNFEFRY